MATANSTPTRAARRPRIKASEAMPAYGAGNGVLSFRHGLRARERGAIDKALEIVGRFLRQNPLDLSSPDAVKTYLRLQLAGEQREHFAVLFLDVGNRFIAFERMFIGTLTETSVYPRELACAALAHSAVSVVLAHNHPSGDVQPSAADIALTKSMQYALRLMDVRVLDHVIVTSNDALSMCDQGLL